jgi:hypothetical protein
MISSRSLHLKHLYETDLTFISPSWPFPQTSITNLLGHLENKQPKCTEQTAAGLPPQHRLLQEHLAAHANPVASCFDASLCIKRPQIHSSSQTVQPSDNHEHHETPRNESCLPITALSVSISTGSCTIFRLSLHNYTAFSCTFN